LIRHGECELDDADPALTPLGLETVRQIVFQTEQRRAEAPEVIFHSPLQRARQTAECFVEYWKAPLRMAEWLLPHAEPSQVFDQLNAGSGTRLALVGHMPNLGRLLAVLLWGLPAREATVPRAGVAALQTPVWEPGKAKLEWFLKPDEETS